MANLIIKENKVERTAPAVHGEEITIQTPCDCTAVTGVQIAGVAYPFYDASGRSLADIDGLFANGSLIRVMIDTENTRAYILNADTNAYLEAKFDTKAPAGYGLGTKGIKHATNYDANNCTENGWWTAATNVPVDGTWLIHVKTGWGTIIQEAYGVLQGVGISGQIVARRSCEKMSGQTEYKWTPWEYVNPLMVANTEYRTTERYNNKAVYKKADANGNRFWRVDGETLWRREDTDTDSISLVDGGNKSINSAGWYRIGAIPVGAVQYASTLVNLTSGYNGGVAHDILFYVQPRVPYKSPEITIISSGGSANYFKKIRVVELSSGSLAIDVYCGFSLTMLLQARFISMHYTRTVEIVPARFASVAETVDGETVLTEQETAIITGGNLVTDTMLSSMGVAKVEPFSYVGTGTYGANNPNSLTFAKPPKLLMVTNYLYEGTTWCGMSYSYSGRFANIEVMTTSYRPTTGLGSGVNNYGKKSADGKTIYWYNTNGAQDQFNLAGSTYYGLAFF